ncbi:dTDP-4-dehydrorhamnose reductase [Novosphingopyxis sp. YJ-S2-01]|nr:dTDP-4-dehydrorhamnose reductase [Novosphingopyxis sp. YJ-S2-01]
MRRLDWTNVFHPVFLDRTELDLTDAAAIVRLVEDGYGGAPFAAVVNAGAYTAVDRAETEQILAWETNAMAPAAFAEACAKTGTPLIQLSTDYVFSGEREGSWEVDDETKPINVYGASKLGGELAIRASGARHVIIRTAWVVSAHGQNFLKTMLKLGASRDALNVVADQFGSPTSAADLAVAVQTIALAMARDAKLASATVHFSNAGETHWADFASEIFRQSALRGGPFAEVGPIAGSDYPTPAKRPSNSLLNHREIEARFGIVPRPWKVALGDILDELLGAAK